MVLDQRRWLNLVNPAVQLKLLFLLVCASLFNVALLGGFLWYCLDRILENGSISSTVYSDFWLMGFICAGAVIAVTVIFGYVLLRESNRVVGPIYRVTNELKEIHRSGTVDPISVRTEDHCQELVKTLNLVLLDLSNRIDD